MSVKNCILADFLMVQSIPLPISVFQNELSLHSNKLLQVPLFGKQCCKGTDVTREAVTLLQAMKVWTPGRGAMDKNSLALLHPWCLKTIGLLLKRRKAVQENQGLRRCKCSTQTIL